MDTGDDLGRGRSNTGGNILHYDAGLWDKLIGEWKMGTLVTVDAFPQVVENIRTYQQALHHCRSVPAGVWHWYYLPSEDITGPSRFIGYQGMTAERYDSEPVHGSKTQAALKRLGVFIEIGPGHRHFESAFRAASRFLPPGKELQPNAKFHIPSSQG